MWYYAQAGQQLGPVSEEQIKRMARDGSLGKEDLVWQEGMASWQPAGEVPGFEFPAPAYSPAPVTPPSPTPVVVPPPPPPAAITPAPYAPPQVQAPPTPYGGPPPVIAPSGAGTDIPDLMIWSIVVTLLCCLPTGIVSIIYANKANTAKQAGDFETARQASKTAKTWMIVSVVATALAVMFGMLSSILIPMLQHAR